MKAKRVRFLGFRDSSREREGFKQALHTPVDFQGPKVPLPACALTVVDLILHMSYSLNSLKGVI